MSNDAIGAILERMRHNPKNVRFTDLLRVCEHVKQVLSAIDKLEVKNEP